jgi:hypothetical protein
LCPARIIDQQFASGGQDGVVDGVPGGSEPSRDPGDRHPIDDQALQRPQHRVPGQLRPRRRRSGGVLAPDPLAPAALVAAHPKQQSRGPPPERDVCEPTGDGVPQHPLTAAPSARLVRLQNAALQHRAVIVDLLAGDRQAEPVQQAEGVQIRGRERSVGHVEVFQMGGVRTPIIGRPRPLPGTRRARLYTLICDEPHTWGMCHRTMVVTDGPLRTGELQLDLDKRQGTSRF